MPLYEHVFLARQDVTAQQVETMVETYKGVIEENGGKIEKIEMWGVKSLAYRIKKNRKAHFTLLNVEAPPAALAEMERQMQISEDVLRFMTIRVEELEVEPSAMMQKRDRDDRKDRDRGRRLTTRASVAASAATVIVATAVTVVTALSAASAGRTKSWHLVLVVAAVAVVRSSVVARPARSRARTLRRSTIRT